MDPSKKELYTAKRASNVNVDDPRIAETWNLVRSDSSPENWMVLGFSAPTSVCVNSFGSGGVEELIAHLNDDEILFCALRCSISGATKFFHLFFVGENVSGMKRGKSTMYESGIFQAIGGAHGKISCTNGKGEVTKEFIQGQIMKIANLPNTASIDC